MDGIWLPSKGEYVIQERKTRQEPPAKRGRRIKRSALVMAMLILASLLGLAPATPAEAQTTRGVILVGGNTNTVADLQPAKQQIEALGFEVDVMELARHSGVFFNWPGTGSNVESAETLEALVDQFLVDNPQVDSVDLVGVSQGILAVRHYVKFLDAADEIDGVISFSGVNLGVDLDAWVGGCYLLGVPGCIETAEGSTYLADLNAFPSTPGGYDYYHIYTEFSDDPEEDVEAESWLPAGHTYTVWSGQDLCPGVGIPHAGGAGGNDAMNMLTDAALFRDPLPPPSECPL